MPLSLSISSIEFIKISSLKLKRNNIPAWLKPVTHGLQRIPPTFLRTFSAHAFFPWYSVCKKISEKGEGKHVNQKKKKLNYTN